MSTVGTVSARGKGDCVINNLCENVRLNDPHRHKYENAMAEYIQSIRNEYQQRYKALMAQYGAKDQFETRGLDENRHVIWVVPRDELHKLETWSREQYEAMRVSRLVDEKTQAREAEREAAIAKRETNKREARQEREQARVNRPVFIGNDCLVCNQRIEPTGKRGRPAVVHKACKAQWKVIQKAQYEATRCQECRHEAHEGICGAGMVPKGKTCQCGMAQGLRDAVDMT